MTKQIVTQADFNADKTVDVKVGFFPKHCVPFGMLDNLARHLQIKARQKYLFLFTPCLMSVICCYTY